MPPNITAVILAAGKGTRMLPLTETKPKPLQKVRGKNLIEWKLDALPEHVDEIVMIIGYQGDQIKAFFGDTWNRRPVRYVVQHELNGTAGALWAAKDILKGRFLVMMGDDLYDRTDVENMSGHDLAVCVKEVENKEMGGEMKSDENGNFIGIDEPRHFVERGLVNTGLYMLDERIFDYAPQPIGGKSTEFGLPHTLVLLARNTPVKMIKATRWMQISAPEDLIRAEKSFFI